MSISAGGTCSIAWQIVHRWDCPPSPSQRFLNQRLLSRRRRCATLILPYDRLAPADRAGLRLLVLVAGEQPALKSSPCPRRNCARAVARMSSTLADLSGHAARASIRKSHSRRSPYRRLLDSLEASAKRRKG